MWLFESDNKRHLKKLEKLAKKVEDLEPKYQAMTNDELRNQTNDQCQINIFSDSGISIRGVREWIFHWIYNANKSKSNMLINYEGKPVANQIYFKVIFNTIILNNLDVHFYHQKGHIIGNQYKHANRFFEENNGISLMRLGLTPEYISSFNNYVDGRSRDILRQYFNQGNLAMNNGISFDPERMRGACVGAGCSFSRTRFLLCVVKF